MMNGNKEKPIYIRRAKSRTYRGILKWKVDKRYGKFGKTILRVSTQSMKRFTSPLFFKIIFLFPCFFYLGWMSCLISFELCKSSCEVRRTSEHYKNVIIHSRIGNLTLQGILPDIRWTFNFLIHNNRVMAERLRRWTNIIWFPCRLRVRSLLWITCFRNVYLFCVSRSWNASI